MTEVDFTLLDTNAEPQNNFGVSGCALDRSGLTVATAATYEPLASVPATEGAPGVVHVVDDTIDFATVNNSRYGYWLECRVLGYNPTTGIYGANVIYTITTTNG